MIGTIRSNAILHHTCNIYRKGITIFPTSLSQLKFSIGTSQPSSTVIITNHCLHTKNVLHAHNLNQKSLEIARDRYKRISMVKTTYTVVKRAFCLVKAETSFFLDALDFRLDLGIRQNIIGQLLQ